MILHPNHTATVTRGNNYGATVASSIDVYIYEQSDEQDAMNGVEWGQNEQRMLTMFAWLNSGDKVVDDGWSVYIIKKVKHRNSVVANFYEIQIRSEND